MDKRVRSPNYPALSLPDAIAKVAQVYGAIHTHAATREVIAKAMGYTGLNGASATAISALHKYGLLERLGNEEIKVSDRALQISHPHSPRERADAVRAAARDPSLFAELYEKFPGKMPNDDLLRNYLVRKGFATSALTAVISAFRETSEMVEHENAGYGSPVAMTEDQEPIMPSPTHATPAQIPPSAPPIASGNERPIGRYDYEGGAYVRITASGDIDTEEALDMVETLIQMKRAEIKRKNRNANAAPAETVAEPTDEEDFMS